VLGLLKGFASMDLQKEPAQPQWEKAQAELLSHPILQLKHIRTTFLNLIANARCLWQVRENTHFEVTRILPILRHAFLEMGKRLRDSGVIDSPEEVFHLKFRELESLGEKWPPGPKLTGELHAAMLKRKELRISLADKPLIDPQLYRQGEPAGNQSLRGTPGSPGIAQGPVRIIHDASEFGNLRQGEVLVAPYTNPAWTPLFQRAIAVVVDGGAAGSHAAIVAREYGLPAVMGTVVGTPKLHDGEWVLVDGNQGFVQPAKPQVAE
jgi:pyruvate,water dikinase